MPLPAHLLDQLAAHLLQAVDLIQGKSAPPRDLVGLRGWLQDLGDEAMVAVLRDLPPGNELVMTALGELAKLGAMPEGVLLPNAPHVTSIGIPIVDRVEVWSDLLALHSTEKRRILLVRGEKGVGKSHIRWLVEELCTRLGDQHVVLPIDLEDIRTVERAVNDIFAHLGTKMQLESRYAADTSDLAWARTTATLVFNRVRVELAGRTPWVIFDHFERMPRTDEAAAFFNQFTQLVAKQRLNAPNTMRLVLIDKREVPPDSRTRTLMADLPRIGADDLKRFVHTCKPSLTAAEAEAEVAAILQDLDERDGFMDQLRERVEPMVTS